MAIDEPQRYERRYDDWGQRNNEVRLPEAVVAKVLQYRCRRLATLQIKRAL